MGCLTRIGCAVILLSGAAGGYWLYGDRFPAALGKAAGSAGDRAQDLAAKISAWRDGDSTNSKTNDLKAKREKERAEADQKFGWVSIQSGANGAANGAAIGAASGKAATLGRDVLEQLRRSDGPDYVSLKPADVADLLAPLAEQIPASAGTLQFALRNDMMYLRVAISLKEFAGTGLTGSILGGALDGSDTLRMGGVLSPLRPGEAQFHVKEMQIRGVELPPRLIPPITSRLRTGATRDPLLAPDALAIPLPPPVSDMRVVDGQLTLYRGAGSTGNTGSNTRR